MSRSDAMLGGARPFGFGYWPLAEDDPASPSARGVRLVTPDGALVRGILWTPPAGTPWKTAVVLVAPARRLLGALRVSAARRRGLRRARLRHPLPQQRHRLPARGAASSTCKAAVDEMRRRGAEAVVLLGNSGGGSLMALAQREAACGDGFIAIAAHPGEGVFMMQVIDPSVADESDPFSVVPELDMYDPGNGWRPWPEPCRYDRAGSRPIAMRSARASRASTRSRARRSPRAASGRAAKAIDKRSEPHGVAQLAAARRRTTYLVIHRTLADPAYLDLTIDPDDRPMGSLFAFPDPFDANYGGSASRAR